MDMVNVDFEFFDPQPSTDFHGLKNLCRQLFDLDAQLFDLSALVDLILAQPMLGTTVKCDGKESDPFAFLTVLNLRQHAVSFMFCSVSFFVPQFALSPTFYILFGNNNK
jgi:protein BCP1